MPVGGEHLTSYLLWPLAGQGPANLCFTTVISCDVHIQGLQAVGHHGVQELPETVSLDDVTFPGR